MRQTRRIVQSVFLALTLAGVFVVGANAERWCPFGGVEALYTYAREGNMVCSLGTSNFCILGGVVVMTLLLRRAFCGYMCPIGTISEWLHAAGRLVRIPELRVSVAADRVLALLKYAALGLILWFTWRSGELMFRGYDPCYALISRHGADITVWAYVVSAAIVVASLAVTVPFCRWLCPMAAVLHLFSFAGLTRVKRDPAACTGCRRCADACPMAIPVDQLRQVTAPRCTSCLSCLDACPKTRSGALVWGPPGWLGRRWSQAVLILVVLACTGGAVAMAYVFPMPSFIKSRGEPPAATASVLLKIDGLACRGRANYLVYFLDRDDAFSIPGYLKVEAWPGPGFADVRLTFDPQRIGEEAIRQAVTEPYYDVLADRWRPSPFAIEGYDPLGMGIETGPDGGFGSVGDQSAPPIPLPAR
jgi:hypothetical protein